MSKNQFLSRVSEDKQIAMLLRALGGGAGAWSLAEAARLERRADYNLSKLTVRQITRGASRVAME